MTILEAVGNYIASSGTGTLGTNLFLARMPDQPNVCIAVYEYPGEAPVETMATGAQVDRPRFQVKVRAGRDDYPIARDLADQIRTLLMGVAGQTLSGLQVLKISAVGGIAPVGSDPDDRPSVVVNFSAMVLR
jgi:hypothetical protein